MKTLIAYLGHISAEDYQTGARLLRALKVIKSNTTFNGQQMKLPE